MTKRSVYYLPGRGGEITTGLGEGLSQRGCAVTGRETTGAFRRLSFQDQIDIVCNDLQGAFWDNAAHVVAVSYGAYLFLHAQAQIQPYPGSVLLLSPIIGQFSNDEIQLGFIPPRAQKLCKLADAGTYSTPLNCEIHVGSEDWQSNPKAVASFGDKVGIPVTIAKGLGHNLCIEYVSSILQRWLHPEHLKQIPNKGYINV